MAKIIKVISLFLITGIVLAQQQEIKPGTPSGTVYQLLSIYKTMDFKRALDFTIGNEKEDLIRLLEAMDKNYGKPPAHYMKFLSSIDDLRIIDETIKDQYARVDVLWILKTKDSLEKEIIKAREVAYLLENRDKKWYIRSSRFINEHVFFNYAALQEMYKKATPYDRKTQGEKGK